MLEIQGKDRILLLQGPMGDFFTRFAAHLRSSGARVWKINFNGGDLLFYRGANTTNYRGPIEDWPRFLCRYLAEHRIEKIFLFGDCRHYHREAIKVARDANIEIYVFEEGYIRPDYITLEKNGVNGFSALPKDSNFYKNLAIPASEPVALPVRTSFWRMAMAAMSYYLAGACLRFYFRNYEHHKSFSIRCKGSRWLMSGARKLLYTRRDAKLNQRLAGELSKRYFLVPLQVHNDSQVTCHSSYANIEDFIREVIASFANHAPAKTLLVLKHHPMDRGARHYGKLIESLSNEHDVRARVIYTHQIHLPTALNHARGVVVINSTVGLSALLHNAPVKTMGGAIYDMAGLTCQSSLDDFWSNTGKVSQKLLRAFRYFVIITTQLNGSFFGRTQFMSKPISRPANDAKIPGIAPRRIRLRKIACR